MSQEWRPPANWHDRPICILGAGVLGRRIASCFGAAGYLVRIQDPLQKARNDAVAYVQDNLSTFTALTAQPAGVYEALEDFTVGVKDCWLVVEAVPEVLSIKEGVFADLEKDAPPDCILATSSKLYQSRQLLGRVQDKTKARVLNTHFSIPPKVLTVELMTSGYTHPEIFPFLAERLNQAGLHPVVALKESSGFIFDRIWTAVKREVLAILAEGISTPDVIDKIWVERCYAQKLGPCKMMDYIGLDTVEHIEEQYIKERGISSSHLYWLQDNYISAGRVGNKATNKGSLYPPAPPGARTKVLLLNLGLTEPLKGKSNQQILHSGYIMSLDMENPGSSPVTLVKNLPNPDGIDVSRSTERMYWTCMGIPWRNDGFIQSANLDGSDVQYVLQPGVVHTPKQILIDQETDRIYFCDREGLRVWRCNLDGSMLETLYQSGDWKTEPSKTADGTFWPVGIALSKKLNKLFWTQKGHSKSNEGRIFSAGLDLPEGESPSARSDVELVIDGLPECIDLEFDDEDKVLYWTDRGELPFGNTLNKKHITSEPPEEEKALGRQIIAQGLGEGIGLRLDKENKCIYVADLGGRLWKCSTEGFPKEKVLEGPTDSYSGVCFYRI